MLRLALVAIAGALHASALNFYVEPSTVNECGQTKVEFTKGTPPYQITAIAAFSTTVNFTVPDTSLNEVNGRYSYAFALPFATNKDVTFIMSDATGFGSGGVSPLFKVGGRPAGESCALASENPLFTFAVYPEGNKIKQCQDVNFTWEGKATGSVFIFGVVPGGMLQVPPSPGTGGKQNFGPARFPVGTTVIYAAWDSTGQPGGTSSLTSITAGDGACMSGDNVLSTTPVAWNPTQTSPGGASQTSARGAVITVTATPIPKGSTALTAGAIAGIVVGVILAVLILQAILVWFCCRRQIRNLLANRKARKNRNSTGGVDLYERRTSEPMVRRDEADTISPFMGGSAAWESQHSLQHSLNSHSANGGNGMGSGTYSAGHSPHTSHYYPPPSSSGASTFGVGTGSSRLPSKLQMAMQNPDNEFVESEGPPATAPAGGYRRHEDAGPILPPQAEAAQPPVEDLPPTYNPQWGN